jgi:hypothetical protein
MALERPPIVTYFKGALGRSTIWLLEIQVKPPTDLGVSLAAAHVRLQPGVHSRSGNTGIPSIRGTLTTAKVRKAGLKSLGKATGTYSVQS